MPQAKLDKRELETALEDSSFDYIEKFINLASLPKTMSDILREEMMAFMSESPCPTGQNIADSVGCSLPWVYKSKNDVRYIAAKGKILDMWYRSQGDRVYKAIIETAEGGKVGAQRLYMESVGKTSKRIETHHTDDNAMLSDNVISLDDAVTQFLIMVGTKGWSLEMIADKWRMLKASQAF